MLKISNTGGDYNHEVNYYFMNHVAGRRMQARRSRVRYNSTDISDAPDYWFACTTAPHCSAAKTIRPYIHNIHVCAARVLAMNLRRRTAVGEAYVLACPLTLIVLTYISQETSQVCVGVHPMVSAVETSEMITSSNDV